MVQGQPVTVYQPERAAGLIRLLHSQAKTGKEDKK
jgi:hypothetical protein